MKKLLFYILILSSLISVFGCVSLKDRKKEVVYIARVSNDSGLLGDDVVIATNFGYIDDKGNYIIEPQFYFAEDFSRNGLALVCNEKNYSIWGYIDITGTYVIAPQFAWARSFSDNGLACVEDPVSDLYGYIDEKGDYVIEPQFDNAKSFSDYGLARVYKNDLWGYIDETGEFVIEPQFGGDDFTSYCEDFSPNGLACVKDPKNHYYGYIDEKGDYVIKPQFDKARSFSDYGLASVCKNDLWGYIDETGEFVIEPQFGYDYPEGSGDFSPNGLACVVDPQNDNYGYIDKTGDYVVEPQFEYAWDFSEYGLALVEKTADSFYYIDRNGNEVNAMQYWPSDIFSGGDFAVNGLAAVRSPDNGYAGYIDETGEFVIDPQFRSADKFVEVYK